MNEKNNDNFDRDKETKCNESFQTNIDSKSCAKTLTSMKKNIPMQFITNSISDGVSELANNLYEEMNALVGKYGSNAIANLMPYVVTTLERLEKLHNDQNALHVEYEIATEDNEQLHRQYERERKLRKDANEKSFTMEDTLEQKIQSLEDKVVQCNNKEKRAKIKNNQLSECISRLEKNNNELQTHVESLQNRYKDLFKSHCVLVEKQKSKNDKEKDKDHGHHENDEKIHEPILSNFEENNDFETYDHEIYNELSEMSKDDASDHIQISNNRVNRIEKTNSEDMRSLKNDSDGEAKNQASSLYSYAGTSTLNEELVYSDMSKQIERILHENNELYGTKNALNVIKDDLLEQIDVLSAEIKIVQDNLQFASTENKTNVKRIKLLNLEIKKYKSKLIEQAEAYEKNELKSKRFDRLEMARVVNERNDYKYKLYELREAVRWTEMLRANKQIAETVEESKPKSAFSKLFNVLFKKTLEKSDNTENLNFPDNGSDRRRSRKEILKSKSTMEHLTTSSFLTTSDESTSRRHAYSKYTLGNSTFNEYSSKNENEYNLIYGWSILSNDTFGINEITRNLPIPVYCNKLHFNPDVGQMFAAVAVNMNGADLEDNITLIGGSKFYTSRLDQMKIKNRLSHVPSIAENNLNDLENDDVDELSHELEEHTKLVENSINSCDPSSNLWIVNNNTTSNNSTINIVDVHHTDKSYSNIKLINILVTAIAFVPAYSFRKQFDNINMKEFVKTRKNENKHTNFLKSAIYNKNSSNDISDSYMSYDIDGNLEVIDGDNVTKCNYSNYFDKENALAAKELIDPSKFSTASIISIAETIEYFESSDIESSSSRIIFYTSNKGNDKKLSERQNTLNDSKIENADSITSDHQPKIQKNIYFDEYSDSLVLCNQERNSSSENTREILNTAYNDAAFSCYDAKRDNILIQGTQWVGTSSGKIYIFSAVTNYRRTLQSFQIDDVPQSIVHVRGRVFVGVSQGKVLIYQRHSHDHSWDIHSYLSINLGSPVQQIKNLCVVADKFIWCSHRNFVHIIDAKSLDLIKSIQVSQRQDYTVNKMAWYGDGMWISMRLDSRLRLFNVYTYALIQEINIEQLVKKYLSDESDFYSVIRISSLSLSLKRMWIGTAQGVILCIPLFKDGNIIKPTKDEACIQKSKPSGSIVRLYADEDKNYILPASVIPYCDLSKTQISFHGFKNSVNFIIPVKDESKQHLNYNNSIQTSKKNKFLILCGGNGYIEFRHQNVDEIKKLSHSEDITPNLDPHLIMWKI